MASFNAQIASDGRKKAAVLSHERSGTHFLMNTLAANFGYVAKPWWNFDFTLGLNFHAPQGLANYFAQASGKSVLNILKSHHQAGFFESFIEAFTSEFHLFYICREPRSVLASFWKLLAELQWEEGPPADSPSQLLHAQPANAVLRYQKTQAATMLHRWVDHVEGWTALADRLGPDRICVLRYEDLDETFEPTVRSLGDWMGLAAPTSVVKPSRSANVIGSGLGSSVSRASLYTPEDHAFVEGVAGHLLDRFDWSATPTRAAV